MNALLDRLQNESGYKAEEKKNILQRIAEWLKDIIKAIKDILNAGELNGAGKLFTKEKCDELTKIRKMFLEAIDGDIIKNYDTVTLEMSDKGVKKLVFDKSYSDYDYRTVEIASNKKATLDLVTLFVTKNNIKKEANLFHLPSKTARSGARLLITVYPILPKMSRIKTRFILKQSKKVIWKLHRRWSTKRQIRQCRTA